MKKVTARQLIETHFGKIYCTFERAMEALDRETRGYWVPNMLPEQGDYDRPLVLLPINHPMAKLYLSMNASVDKLHRDFVEAQLGQDVGGFDGLDELGRKGLALMAVDHGTVTLRATNPELATLINHCRLGTQPRGTLCHTLVQHALGLPERPKRLKSAVRLQAALIYERFDVDASELLESPVRARLVSKWNIVNKSHAEIAA